MNENMTKTLELLHKQAVLGNDSRQHRMGTLFNSFMGADGKEHDEAFVLTSPPGSEPPGQSKENASNLIRISDFGVFDYPEDKPYYNYLTKSFERNKLVVSPVQLQEKIMSWKFITPIRLPLGNILNFIGAAFPEEDSRRFCRMIIKYNNGIIPSGRGLIPCKFDENGEYVSAKTGSRFKVCDTRAQMKGRDIIPGVIYVCERIRKEDGVQLVSVREPHFKGIQIGLYESAGGIGFWPETDAELYDFSFYKDGRVLNLPELEGVNYDFEPINLDLSIVTNALKMYPGFRYVDLVIGETRLSPVLLVGIRETEGWPLIENYIAPLNPVYRGDMR